MTAGIVVTGLIFWPVAPFFPFMHGKDITIPKGTEVPTFVNGNFALDMAKFRPATPVQPAKLKLITIRRSLLHRFQQEPTSSYMKHSSGVRRPRSPHRRATTPSRSKSRDTHRGKGKFMSPEARFKFLASYKPVRRQRLGLPSPYHRLCQQL